MKGIINNLKGDKVIWSFVALLALISFMPVYSASSNLAYGSNGTGNTISFLLRHFAHVAIGFAIIYFIHKVPYQYFKAISIIGLPIIGFLLVFTLFQGKTIGGANASRWIRVPFIGITFQTSTVASLFLLMYVARYLAKIKDKTITFKKSFLELWLPIFIVILLILPANFSTSALLFLMVIILVFIGKYPIKYLMSIIFLGIAFLLLFVGIVKMFPNSFPNRVDTWMSRIESFTKNKAGEDDYQIEKAKIAIASGGIYGLGPGKSVQKNFLPQSSSDFIFAIIVEEYGIIGGVGILLLYLILFFRFLIAAHKSGTFFGKLLVVGLGFPIVFQALINMSVAVELIPVTGQTLPLISSGGSSIWMTCLAIGIILNVTVNKRAVLNEESISQDHFSIQDQTKTSSVVDDVLERIARVGQE